MKRLFITISLITGILSANAQTIGQKVDQTISHTKEVLKKMQYGVKGGINFSNVKGLGNKSFLIGFNLGVFGRYHIDQNMAIQPELLFSSQRFKTKSSRQVLSNGYLNIPIMFQYRLVDTLAFEVGPQLGFAIIKQYYYENGPGIKPATFDFSMAIGAKYDIGQYFQLTGLDLTARYTIGLTNVYKANNISSNKNSVLQTGLAYTF